MGAGSGLLQNCQVTVGLYGDSQLHGTGANTGLPTKQTGMRWPLWNLGQQAGIGMMFLGSSALGADSDVRQIYHDGIDGVTINSAQANLVTRTGQYPPEVIIYYLGTNDCNINNQAAATSLSQIQTNVAQIWNLGQRAGKNKTKLIILCSPAATPNNNDKTLGIQQGMPAVITALTALGVNVKGVDLFTILGANTAGNAGFYFNPASPPHPNDAGYVLIAQSVFGTPGSGLLCDYGR